MDRDSSRGNQLVKPAQHGPNLLAKLRRLAGWFGCLLLLGIGLLQKSAPELPSFSRVDKQQFVIFDRQPVVDHHVHPLAELPELETRQVHVRAHLYRSSEPSSELFSSASTAAGAVS